jgi:hypothetical protein
MIANTFDCSPSKLKIIHCQGQNTTHKPPKRSSCQATACLDEIRTHHQDGNSSRKRHSISKPRQISQPSAVRILKDHVTLSSINCEHTTHAFISPKRAQPRLRGDTRRAAGRSHVLMQVYLTCIWSSRNRQSPATRYACAGLPATSVCDEQGGRVESIETCRHAAYRALDSGHESIFPRCASALRCGILHTACCKLPLSAMEARRVGLTGLQRY